MRPDTSTKKPQERVREFSDSCWLPAKRQQVFRFFCDPENLERITPPWLHFRVLHQSTPRIEQGTEFQYRMRIHTLPVRWVSRIESWLPGREFVDVQLSGPYALWHHRHRFEDRDGGTLMTDRVRFRLPGGRLGDALAGALVDRDVRRIFRHRREVISELFAERVRESEERLRPGEQAPREAAGRRQERRASLEKTLMLL